jgi:hypothetical protein
MQQVQSYQMDGKMLALKDGSNNIVLVFAAA